MIGIQIQILKYDSVSLIYSHGQELFYKFVGKITNKLLQNADSICMVKENLLVLVVPKNPLWKSTMFKNGKWENASNIELTEKKSNFGFLLKWNTMQAIITN